ncbi:MAG: hypothetical protein JWM34_2356 [Ilumatobacteraceae bacterium]|nr:hypothetical protein [Ilumatobacteraceae bacterium]
MRFRSGCLVLALVATGLALPALQPAAARRVDAAGCAAATIGNPPAVASAIQATGFHAIAPARLLDTRDSGVMLRAGCANVVDLSTNDAIPVDAEALALNVTTVGAASRGFVTVYPCGSPRPASSNVNTRQRDATANSVLVQLDDTHQICIYTQTALHVIVDMTGWFGHFGAPYRAVPSTRVLDTRTTLRPDGGSGLVAPRTELRVPIGGTAVSDEARAVSVNVTTTDATQAGFVTAYPCSSTRPATSTVNFMPGEVRSNHIVVGLDTDGSICLWSNVAVAMVVDVEGWFGGDPNAGTFFQPLLGSRVLDTRDGTGGVTGKVAANTSISFDPSDHARLPLGSTVALNVISTDADAPGFVTLYPCGSPQPSTSSVNAVVGTEATNVAFVGVDATDTVCAFASASMHLVVDVIGTFGPGGTLHQLTVSPLALGQTFTPDAHDYTVRCAAGTNTVTVHAVGAPGALVSVALASGTAPPATAQTVDQTFSIAENDAVVIRAGGPNAPADEYWVRCLPHDFPVLNVTTAETPSPGWYLTEDAFPAGPGDQSRYVMILDDRSVPVWYHRVANPVINPTLLADGTLAWTQLLGLAFGSTPGGAYEIHRLDGTLVRTVSTVSGVTDHHDIAELSNGDVILATYVPRQHVDLRALGAGYGADELVYDNHLEEIRPDGTVAWTWKSEDHIPISATTFPQRFPGSAGTGVDLIHENSIEIAPNGDVVMSARHTDTVYEIRRDAAGTIVMRIGGNQSDVTFVNDPLGGFARQHGAQLLANGDLRLFDNRTNAGQPRAVEYAIDPVAKTATLVWSVSDPAVLSSGGVGSVRSADEGDVVVTWGGSPSPAFTEFTADGSELQATSMPGHYPYRVDKQPISAFDVEELRTTAGR